MNHERTQAARRWPSIPSPLQSIKVLPLKESVISQSFRTSPNNNNESFLILLHTITCVKHQDKQRVCVRVGQIRWPLPVETPVTTFYFKFELERRSSTWPEGSRFWTTLECVDLGRSMVRSRFLLEWYRKSRSSNIDNSNTNAAIGKWKLLELIG